MTRILAVLVALALVAEPAWAGEGSKCGVAGAVLWGDGAHDDTAALNAWFRGDRVVWGQTGRPVGSEIGGFQSGGPQNGGSQNGAVTNGGRVFRLTGPVYIPSGTGRRIEQFAFVWPQRRERVSGGTIVAGADPCETAGRDRFEENRQPPRRRGAVQNPRSPPRQPRRRVQLPSLLIGRVGLTRCG